VTKFVLVQRFKGSEFHTTHPEHLIANNLILVWVEAL